MRNGERGRAIAAGEARFRATFENAAVGIAHVGLDGRWLNVNQRLCHVVGYSREELLSKTFADITHPDEVDDGVQRHALLAGEISSHSVERRYVRKDGRVVWVNVTVSLARTRDGSPDYFIFVHEDVSSRKQAEQALRESESRFRQLAESLPQLVWACRPDGPCDYLSPQWVAYTGIPEAAQLGFGWLEPLHPDDREHAVAAWTDAVKRDAPFDVEFRIRRHDGVYRWFKTRAVALRASDGSVVKWFGSNTDIDDQKRAEEAQRESAGRLAGIVSSAMDAIVTVDESQRIVLFNQAAERMFGWTGAEVLGRSLDRFIPERFRAAHHGQVARFGEAGETTRPMGGARALAALRADGTEFPIEASISQVHVGARKLFTVIVRDITDREQVEAERRRLVEEQAARVAAEAANRAKDEFLALVSHELRAPLNAILGYAMILRSEPTTREGIEEAIEIIERNARTQLHIIEDLLDSARILVGKLRIDPAPIDLVPALEAALDTVRPEAVRKRVALARRLAEGPVHVLGDSTRLQQVVCNLLSNAVKFTPAGGRVELRLEADCDAVRICVSDTGSGIEPELLPFVFDRFRQVGTSGAQRFGGLGLGLSLVRHLIDLHGGTVRAESDGPGCGATFTVTLPRPRPDRGADVARGPAAARRDPTGPASA